MPPALKRNLEESKQLRKNSGREWRLRRSDLAFLDGNHRCEGVFLDLIYSGRLL